MKSKTGFLAGIVALGLISGSVFWANENGWGETAMGADWRLVSESVSKSANLVINLPPDEIPEVAVKKVKLNPEVVGKWSIGKGKLVFDPEGDLEVGRWFEVMLTTKDGELRAEFQVAENPAVVGILPGGEVEVDLESEVTVIFNRAMVPLSEVGEMEGEDGVRLSPETEGRWKWISTRTLQFDPEDELIGSQKYEVKVDKFMESLEGVTLGRDFVHAFETENLKLEGEVKEEVVVGFNKAVEVRFNQEVNLEMTKSQVSLVEIKEGVKKEISVLLGFGENWEWDEDADEEVLKVDKSILTVRPEKNEEGKSGKWNLESEFELEIKEVWGKGNIPWSEKIRREISVPGIVKEVKVVSEKSKILSESSFDPEGHLTIEFWGEVDLERSEITGDRLEKVEVGEKCEDEKDWDQTGCEKVPDETKVKLTFEKGKWESGGKTDVKLKKVVMTDGSLANEKPIVINLTAFPRLEVKDSNPGFREGGSSAEKMILCTTTPLPGMSEWGEEGMVSKKKWVEMLGITPLEFKLEGVKTSKVEDFEKGDLRSFCEEKSEFVTEVNWKLGPKRDYYLNMNLEDQLGQEKKWQTWFQTGEVLEREVDLIALQENVVTTTSDKKVLTWASVNMPKVDVSMCKISAAQMLRMQMEWVNEETSPFDFKCVSRMDEEVILGDKWWQKEMVEIDLDEFWPGQKGHWLVSISGPRLKNSWSGNKRWLHTLVSVTDLNVVTKLVEQDVTKLTGEVKDLIWVSEAGGEMKGIQGAVVETFAWNKETGLVRKGVGSTDEDGIVRVETGRNVRGVLVSKGGDSAIVSDNWAHQMRWSGAVWAGKKMWVESDRSIFRPGEMVHLRGTLRSGWDKNWKVNQGEKVEVVISNGRGEEVWKENVSTDEWGVWTADVQVEKGAMLGTWWVNVRDLGGEQIQVNHFTFEVEEFVAAPFEVKMEVKKEVMDLENVEVRVKAEQFVGVGIAGGKVEVSLESQDFWFDKVKEEGWIWGNGGGFELRNIWPQTHWINWKGEGELNGKGEAVIRIPVDLQKWIKQENLNSQKVTVTARVTDGNGRSVSNEEEFLVHRGEFYLGMRNENWAPRVGEEIRVEGKTVDILGKERAVSGMDFAVEKVGWKEDENGIWEEKREMITQEKISTNRTGNWERILKMEKGGQYEITIKGTDEGGREVKTVMSIWVLGEDAAGFLKMPGGGDEEEKLKVTMEKNELEVGEIAKMAVQLPSGKSKVLWTLERGQVMEWMVVEREGVMEMEWEVKENQAPRVMATVVVLNEGENGNPKVMWGEVEVKVNSDENKLRVEIVPEKMVFEPGEMVKMDVVVTDQKGNPVQAEMKVSVTNEAVEILNQGNGEGMWAWWWDDLQSNVSTAANFKSVLERNERLMEMDKTAGGLGGGGRNF